MPKPGIEVSMFVATLIVYLPPSWCFWDTSGISSRSSAFGRGSRNPFLDVYPKYPKMPSNVYNMDDVDESGEDNDDYLSTANDETFFGIEVDYYWHLEDGVIQPATVYTDYPPETEQQPNWPTLFHWAYPEYLLGNVAKKFFIKNPNIEAYYHGGQLYNKIKGKLYMHVRDGSTSQVCTIHAAEDNTVPDPQRCFQWRGFGFTWKLTDNLAPHPESSFLIPVDTGDNIHNVNMAFCPKSRDCFNDDDSLDFSACPKGYVGSYFTHYTNVEVY